MASVEPFEERMRAGFDFRMHQGSLFFDCDGLLHETLRRIARLLERNGDDYAITGDMAMFVHGFRQHTDHLAIIVSDTDAIQRLSTQGHLTRDPNGTYRDSQSGVAISFLVAGSRTLLGHSLATVVPDPRAVGVNIGGKCYTSLEGLIELKLALGQKKLDSHSQADVYSLIRTCRLSRAFADKLSPAVQEDYRRVWDLARIAQPRMALPWTRAALPHGVESLRELATALGDTFPELHQMVQAGIELDLLLSRETGCPFRYSDDWFVGDRFGMHPEDEYDFDLLKRRQLAAS